MTSPIEAYPLTWPPGRPRQHQPQTARFSTLLGAAIRDVQNEVARLGGSNLVISSNLPLRLDGMPYAKAAQPSDRGVAVYFTHKRRPMCFACDRWNLVEDNMRAIAKTIEALRGIERWGSGQMVEQAFTGFMALAAPEQPFQVLGVKPDASIEEIDEAHRRLAMKHHPDRGGDTAQMARINAARDAMRSEISHRGGIGMSGIDELIETLRYRPVATTAAQMRSAADHIERTRDLIRELAAAQNAVAQAVALGPEFKNFERDMAAASLRQAKAIIALCAVLRTDAVMGARGVRWC